MRLAVGCSCCAGHCISQTAARQQAVTNARIPEGATLRTLTTRGCITGTEQMWGVAGCGLWALYIVTAQRMKGLLDYVSDVATSQPLDSNNND